MPSSPVDELDARLIIALADAPRSGAMELSRTLGVARGTVQARMAKLQDRGILVGLTPDIDLTSIGYEVLSFCVLEIAQGRLEAVVAHLAEIPEVIEAHTISGDGDLHLRVVARTNRHLQEVINQVLEVDGIQRTTTQLALSEQLRFRTLGLVQKSAEGC